MKLGDVSVVELPVVRIVFDNLQEFVELELLALQLGMGKDWPMAMLREFWFCKFSCDQNGGAGRLNEHHLAGSMSWIKSTP